MENNNSNNSIGGSSINNLPEIIIICNEERLTNYKWFDNAQEILCNPSVQLLTKDTLQAQLNITFPRIIHENDMLMLNPFKQNDYIKIEDILDVGKAKFFAYTSVFQQLGACYYRIRKGEEYTKERGTNVKAKGRIKLVNIRFGFNRKDKFRTKYGFDLEGNLDGVRTISDMSYKEAKRIVHERCLDDDIIINDLIEKRNPQYENHKNREVVKLSLYEEVDKRLDMAAKVSSTGIFTINAKVRDTIKETRNIVLTIEVKFPDKNGQ